MTQRWKSFPLCILLEKICRVMLSCSLLVFVTLVCSLPTALSFTNPLTKPIWGRLHFDESPSRCNTDTTTRIRIDTAMSPSQSTELDTNRYDWEAGSNDDSGDDFPLDPDRAVPKEDMKNEADPLLDEYYQWMDAVNKALASLKKKHRSLQNELNKAEKVEETVARAQLLTTYIYMFSPDVTSVVVQDWENDGKEIQLTLDPAYGSASEEADALFQRARKLKRGSKVVSDLLEETSQALNTLQEIQTDLDAALLDDGKSVDENLLHLVQDRLLRTSRMTKFAAPKDGETTALSAKQDGNRKQRKPEIGTPASNLRKLTSPGGCTVLVGRNRRGNEYLSLNIAKGNDIWMQ